MRKFESCYRKRCTGTRCVCFVHPPHVPARNAPTLPAGTLLCRSGSPPSFPSSLPLPPRLLGGGVSGGEGGLTNNALARPLPGGDTGRNCVINEQGACVCACMRASLLHTGVRRVLSMREVPVYTWWKPITPIEQHNVSATALCTNPYGLAILIFSLIRPRITWQGSPGTST
jgi:hypothetical protein